MACRETGDNPIIGGQFGHVAVREHHSFAQPKTDFVEQTDYRTPVKK